MRSISIFVVIVVGFSSVLIGQPKTYFGGGIDFSLPTGDFSDFAGVGFGLNIIGEREVLLPKFDIGVYASAGYMYWLKKTTTEKFLFFGSVYSFSNTTKSSSIPIKLGAKLIFRQGFYLLAEFGGHVMFESFYEGSSTETTFYLMGAPGLGYQVKLRNNLLVDCAIRYEFVSRHSSLGVQASVKYPIRGSL